MKESADKSLAVSSIFASMEMCMRGQYSHTAVDHRRRWYELTRDSVSLDFFASVFFTTGHTDVVG